MLETGKKFLLPGSSTDNEEAKICEGGERKGFARLVPENALGYIQSRLGGNTRSTINSIPKTTAHISYMETQIANNIDGQNLRKWEGMLAIIGLSKIQAFNITIKPAFDGLSFLTKTILEDSLKEELGVKNLQQNVAIIQKDGVPIAITHGTMLICPFCEINPKIFQDVPWARKLVGENLEITGIIWDKPEDYLNNFEKINLRAWLKQLQGPSLQNLEAMGNFIERLKVDGINDQINNTNTIPVNSVDGSSFDDVIIPVNNKVNFSNVPVLPISMPKIFNDTIAIVASAKEEYLGNQFCLSFQCDAHPEPECFGALVPFTKEFIQAVEARKDVTQDGNKLEVQRISISVGGSSLNVTVTINNAGIGLTRQKEYRKEHIRLIRDFPYVTLWPYVSLPAQRWNEYMIAVRKNSQERKVIASFVKEIKEIKGNTIKIDPKTVNGGVFNNKIKARGVNDYEWYINRMNKMPWAINFTAMEAGNNINLGAIFIDPYKVKARCSEEDFTNSCTIALDFGTTNTLCAISDQTGINLQLNALTYLLDVTACEEMDKASFKQKYWMQEKILEEKVPSISQLYGGITQDNLPYEGGRLFINDVKTLMEFCQGNSNLQEKGVYNNLKFYGEENPNIINATKIFLKTMLAFAVLQAKLKGANQLQINVSYPRNEVRQQFQNNAGEILNYLQTYCCCNVNNFVYNTEAESAALYFRTKSLADRPDSGPGFAIIDIGGGTSDISLWKNNDSGEEENKGMISLLYAGRRIVIRSIYETFKLYPNNFSCIWNQQMMRGIIDDGQFKNLVRQLQAWDRQIRISGVELTDFSPAAYNSICNLIETLIEKVRLNTTNIFNNINLNVENFQAFLVGMVRIKFVNLFYVLANFIKKTDAIDTKLGIFRIYLAGGATKALKFCNNNYDINAGEKDNYKSGFGYYLIQVIADILNVEQEELSFIPPSQNMEKQEVVQGLAKTSPDKKVLPVKLYETTDLKWSEELDEALQQRYNTYVNNYLLHTNMLLIMRLNSRISLENENVKNRYKSLKKAIYNIVYSKESQYPDLLKEDIFVILMVENLLNMGL